MCHSSVSSTHPGPSCCILIRQCYAISPTIPPLSSVLSTAPALPPSPHSISVPRQRSYHCELGPPEPNAGPTWHRASRRQFQSAPSTVTPSAGKLRVAQLGAQQSGTQIGTRTALRITGPPIDAVNTRSRFPIAMPSSSTSNSSVEARARSGVIICFVAPPPRERHRSSPRALTGRAALSARSRLASVPPQPRWAPPESAVPPCGAAVGPSSLRDRLARALQPEPAPPGAAHHRPLPHARPVTWVNSLSFPLSPVPPREPDCSARSRPVLTAQNNPRRRWRGLPRPPDTARRCESGG
ncbi:hypothetical protein BV20DRAFT_313021 [Pilatotrama ljubarskyi]|nr:hypothetical protein BV20DRAFT_313021 [Pilatotrama ljubarskyi]